MDNLQKLIAVLIGLSSLYTIVVAVTSYLDGQTYLDEVRNKAGGAARIVDQAGKLLREATATNAGLHEKFDTFMHVNGNLQKLVKSVNDALPEVEPIAPWYESLSGEKKEKIYHWDRSLAFAEVLAGNGVDDVKKTSHRHFARWGGFTECASNPRPMWQKSSSIRQPYRHGPLSSARSTAFWKGP